MSRKNIISFLTGFCFFRTPAAESHGLCPWMNAPAFGRDFAPLGREEGCHGLCPWGSTKSCSEHSNIPVRDNMGMG